jgi:DNA helicase IV
MEITFTPGLTESKGLNDETTLDKYERKMRDKRKKKKETKPVDASAEADEFFDKDDLPAPTKNSSTVSVEKTSRSLSTAEELSLLVASDHPIAEPRHFDMKAILKAEKQAKRKGKRGKNVSRDAADEMQEDFTIDVNDSRFQVLHDNHAYAIDPSNPQ